MVLPRWGTGALREVKRKKRKEQFGSQGWPFVENILKVG